MRNFGPAAGFTLIEVMIALVIVAVGLGAAVRATMQVTSGAELMKLRTLAVWIAEDRLAEHAARRSWPAPGASTGALAQANVQFGWREQVRESADPSLRSVGVEVYAASDPAYVLARVTGIVTAPVRTP